MEIRPFSERDRSAIWRVLEPHVRAGEVYAFPTDWTERDALAYWCADGHEVFVAVDGGEVVGTYYLRANQRGNGAHVANAGYATGTWTLGRGVARAMCEHSIERARARGFGAIQFNFVVSTNERAVRLWRRCGFAVVGRLPGAFVHPRLGPVDALVMYRSLGAAAGPFRFLLRVRYGECDAQGVVFNARWGDYVDVAVTEYSRAVFGGTDAAVTGEWQLVKQTLQWRAPARYDDVLEVRVQTAALGTTSFTITSELRRHGADAVLATAETVYVMIDPAARTKVPITPAQRAALERGAPSVLVDHAGAL